MISSCPPCIHRPIVSLPSRRSSRVLTLLSAVVAALVDNAMSRRTLALDSIIVAIVALGVAYLLHVKGVKDARQPSVPETRGTVKGIGVEIGAHGKQIEQHGAAVKVWFTNMYGKEVALYEASVSADIYTATLKRREQLEVTTFIGRQFYFCKAGDPSRRMLGDDLAGLAGYRSFGFGPPDQSGGGGQTPQGLLSVSPLRRHYVLPGPDVHVSGLPGPTLGKPIKFRNLGLKRLTLYFDPTGGAPGVYSGEVGANSTSSTTSLDPCRSREPNLNSLPLETRVSRK